MKAQLLTKRFLPLGEALPELSGQRFLTGRSEFWTSPIRAVAARGPQERPDKVAEASEPSSVRLDQQMLVEGQIRKHHRDLLLRVEEERGFRTPINAWR